jgi:DNA-binding Lrp family transcriptional regulator
LGIEAGAYAVEISSRHRKGEALERLRTLEGVYFLQIFRGNLVGVAFAYEGDRSRAEKIAAIHRITGAETGIFSRVMYPPCNITPSRAEWKLVSRLVRGPFRDYTTLARDLGVSVRTVKRRISKLVHAHAVLSVPTMDYRALSGCVPVDLLVAFASPETRPEAEREIFRLLGNQVVYAGVWADLGMYSLLLPRLSGATQLAEQVPAIPGVRLARAEIVEEHIDLVEALQKYVDRQWVPAPQPTVRKATAAA